MQQFALCNKAAAPDENRVDEFFGLRFVDEVFEELPERNVQSKRGPSSGRLGADAPVPRCAG
mgnify:CR=1 FL=1